MPITSAPKVLAGHAAAVLTSPTAVAVLHLGTGVITVDTDPSDQIWAAPDRLVLLTHDDAVAAARRAATAPEFLPALVAALNADLQALADAGEIPTAEEVAAVLAELEHFEAEVVDLASRRRSA